MVEEITEIDILILMRSCTFNDNLKCVVTQGDQRFSHQVFVRYMF